MSKSTACINNAILSCLSDIKKYSSPEHFIDCLIDNDRMAHSRLRHAIASDIAALLSANYGDIIKAVSIYGSTMQYTAGKYSDIDLIIKIRKNSIGISEILKELNAILTKEYYLLLGESFDEYNYLLDFHIINEDPTVKKHPSRAYLEYIFNMDAERVC